MVNASKFHYSLFDETENAMDVMDQQSKFEHHLKDEMDK